MTPGGDVPSGRPDPSVPVELRPAAEWLFGEACGPDREGSGDACGPDREGSGDVRGPDRRFNRDDRGQPSGEACDPNRAGGGDRLARVEEYARLLITDGVVRGLVGPREAPRIWERHLLNCAVVAELIPVGTAVTDVGSGAGLPGIVLAIARPDLGVTLVEPKERRAAFLSEVVARLALDDQITVVRARAEESPGRVPLAGVVTARALAPLDRLAGWCLPLVRTGGRVLAIKGESAAEEIVVHAEAVRRVGGGTPTIRQCGVEVLAEPTTVIEVIREHAAPDPTRVAPGSGGPRRRPRPTAGRRRPR